MQSVPITTKIVSSNPTHGEMYSIQHYVIKFVSGFSPGIQVSSTNNTDCHNKDNIAEIFSFIGQLSCHFRSYAGTIGFCVIT